AVRHGHALAPPRGRRARALGAAGTRASGDRAAFRAARHAAVHAGGGRARVRRHARAHPPDREQHPEEARVPTRSAGAQGLRLAAERHDWRAHADGAVAEVALPGALEMKIPGAAAWNVKLERDALARSHAHQAAVEADRRDLAP